MSNIIDQQFTRRFAPNCIDQSKLTDDAKMMMKNLGITPISVILLDRVKSMVDKDLTRHELYYGSHGRGKSTVALVRVGLDINKKPFPWSMFETLYINCSKDANIDTLRGKIETFCTNAQFSDDGKVRQKVVFLDEIDGVRSEAFSDALRSFMDAYEQKVKFIATCNHIMRVIAPIRSRFDPCINFDPMNEVETKELDEKYRKRLKSIWTNVLKRTCTDEAIIMLATKTKNDIRAGLKNLQVLYENVPGELTATNIVAGMTTYHELYDFLFQQNRPTEEDIHIHLSVRYQDKGYEVLQDMHQQLVDYIIEKHPNLKKLIGVINIQCATYLNAMNNGVDPFLCMKACIFQILQYAK